MVNVTSIIKDIDVGKDFAKRLASIRNFRKLDKKVLLSDIEIGKIRSLVPFITGYRAYADLYNESSVLSLGEHSKSLLTSTKLSVPLGQLSNFESALYEKGKVIVRAVQTDKFMGAKVVVEYPDYTQGTWLSIVYQLIRAVQAMQLSTVEERLLNSAEQGTNLFDVPKYHSDIAAALGLLLLPSLKLTRDRTQQDKCIIKRIFRSVYFQRVDNSMLKDDTDRELPLEYSTHLYWMIALLKDVIQEKSNEVLVVRDIKPDISFVPLNSSFDKGTPGRVLLNYHVNGSVKKFPLHPRPILKRQSYQVTRASAASLSILANEIANTELLTGESYSYIEDMPFSCDRTLRCMYEKNMLLPQDVTPVSLGISIGLEVSVTKKHGEKGLYMLKAMPVIRLELKNRSNNANEIVIFKAIPKFLELQEIL